jgi:hypothetical protein
MPVIVGRTEILDKIVQPVAPSFTWQSAAGRQTAWSSKGHERAGILVQPGAIGLGMPDYTLYSNTSPAFDGTSVRGHRAEERQIALPLLVYGDSRADFLPVWRRLVTDVAPARRLGRTVPGTLSLIPPVGAGGSLGRSIEAFYAGGLGGNDDDKGTGMQWASVVLSLRCPSPYWLGDTVIARFQLAAPDDFYPYTWPLMVSDSQVLGELVAVNEGEVEAYPVFEITGPMDSANLINQTTGELMNIGGGLDPGHTMTIDTRESARSVLVVDEFGEVTNRYADLSLDSTLWALAPGDNQVALEIPGADVGSSLTITYRPRYLTAY